MNVLICGISGKMGQRVYHIIKDYKDVSEVIGFDKNFNLFLNKTFSDLDYCLSYPNIELVVDFTENEISREIIKKSLEKGISVISGTTGLTDKEIEKFKQYAKEKKISFYWSPNYSFGYEIMLKQINDLKQSFNKYEIVETHNVTKKDKPSGTSKKIAKILKLNKKDIQSVRLNDVIAIHEVSFLDNGEKITIVHEILNRSAFLNGFIRIFDEIVEKAGD